ncbi:MAG: glycine cleavage system aminomethyltransferase GcvT [Candidatus Heimdallarchaeota archaeon]|nr:glycine cleavage system aminomethyltransferase GcvT [Candidatus Heimdallarchaeota archaeon]
MKTPLYDYHANNSDIIEFVGFKLPVMYSSIKTEHMAVRNAAGIFDVSHMGRMWITGEHAEKFINLIVPRDITKTPVGRAAYTFMLNELGGFRDDLVFEHLEDNKWLVVWNAGNLMKIKNWLIDLHNFQSQFKKFDISLEDISSESAMFALQGPKAKEVLGKSFQDFEPPSPWGITTLSIEGIEIIVSGTGYTGEAGFEIIVLNASNDNPTNAVKIWNLLLEEGKDLGLLPCGLGARDSLRLEAGLSLYGNDINENINPIEADLFFPPFIHIDKPFFIGRNALLKLQSKKKEKTRIGFVAVKKGPSPRAGLELYKDDKLIGITSSGGYSPLLEIGIGMGYVLPEYAGEDTRIQFKVREKLHEAIVKKFPLFNPDKFGGKRKS